MKSKEIFIFGFIITIICFKFIYGLSVIVPTNINWLMSEYHDWGQHYLGWSFYKEENWTFPIGTIQNYNYPAGSNIGFTDSIPIVAIFFKVFKAILPNDFQYFGLWFLICHLLITYYTIKILQLYKASTVLILFSVVFISLNPVLLYRGMHPALCAHWIILASFYYYFKSTTNYSVIKLIKYQIGLLLLTAAIHPYLLIIVAVFNVILPLKSLLYKKIKLIQFVCYTTIPFLLVILIWYVIGLIRFENNEALEVHNSYGLFSTNMNALFNAQGFSKFTPQLNFYKVNQYEGFSYLGVGFIVLIIFIFFYKAIFWKKTAVLRLDKSKILFSIAVLFLALFAITNQVTFNDKLLFEIPLPEIILRIGNIFRASGRFIWVFYYSILFYTLIYYSKLNINKYLQITVLTLTLSLQIYDISSMMFRYKETGTFVSKKINQQDWIDITKPFKKIITFPPFENNLLTSLDYQDLCFVALKNKLSITCGYVARDIGNTNNEYKKQLEKELNEAVFDKNNIFITTEKYLNSFYPLINSEMVNVKELNNYYFIFSNKVNIKNIKQFIDKTSQMTDFVKKELRINKENDLTISTDELINYNFDVNLKSEKTLSLQGWSYFKDEKLVVDSIKVGLLSKNQSYFAQTKTYERPDLVTAFNRNDILKSGFKTTLFLNQLSFGNYNLIIGLKDKNGWIYQRLDEEVVIQRQIHPVQIKNIPKEKGNVIGNLDDFKIDKDKIELNGWAAIQDYDCTDIEHEIIIFNENDKYSVKTENSIRNDVSQFYNVGKKYNKSGYKLRINKSEINKGKYKIGIYLFIASKPVGFKIISEKNIN